MIGAELYPDNQSPLHLFQCYPSKLYLSITCMSVSRNLIIRGILLLPEYAHTYSCADIQSLSILISTTSTAWDHAATFKSTTVTFFRSSQIANVNSIPFICYG